MMRQLPISNRRVAEDVSFHFRAALLAKPICRRRQQFRSAAGSPTLSAFLRGLFSEDWTMVKLQVTWKPRHGEGASKK